MQLTNYLTAAQVLPACVVAGKAELLERMVESLLQPRVRRLNPDIDRAAILAAVLAREAERPTVMGNGMAFPHARIAGFRGLALSLAVLKEPMDFGSGDPVHVACLMIVPQEAPMMTLRVMSRVAAFFRDPAHRASLLAARSGDEVMRMLTDGDLSIDIPVTARDIMTPPGLSAHADTPLRQVSREMHAHNLNVLPIVDDAGHLIGDVTCDRLFQFGLPDFFHQLKSVSFISEFDPFEKYFSQEAHSQARAVLLSDICRMPPEATLLEIVFELAVKRRSQVYVVEADGRWVGTVDRDDVLNNVLNW